MGQPDSTWSLAGEVSGRTPLHEDQHMPQCPCGSQQRHFYPNNLLLPSFSASHTQENASLGMHSHFHCQGTQRKPEVPGACSPPASPPSPGEEHHFWLWRQLRGEAQAGQRPGDFPQPNATAVFADQQCEQKWHWRLWKQELTWAEGVAVRKELFWATYAHPLLFSSQQPKAVLMTPSANVRWDPEMESYLTKTPQLASGRAGEKAQVTWFLRP